MATNIIIDCDPGCDDAIALIAALHHPELNVLGITSIGGNVDPVKTQKNALGICALVNRTDVPVYAGCDRPLVKRAVLADDVHGETGVQGLVLPFDRASSAHTDMDAADFILATTASNKDVTLIVIGPMTNIATAFLRDNSLPARVKQIVTMGAAFGNPGGNINDGKAEFNIFCDPHAAKIVYDNFSNITVMPLDVTHRTLQDAAFRGSLMGIGTQGANVANMLAAYAETYPADDMAARKVSPLHDFHTVAFMVAPTMYRLQAGRVDVTTEGPNEGQTILREGAATSPHRVALGVDSAQFFNVLHASMARAIP